MPRTPDLLRRLHADLVKGRTTVRMATPVRATALEKPIFVAGIFRSGTTLVRLILDSHSRIACPPETTFLIHLKEMVDDSRSEAGFEGMGFERDAVVAQCADFASGFFESYASSWGKPRWADKSPAYVEHLAWLIEVFPEAQFVSLLRNPLDQIHSHTNGGVVLPDRIVRFDSGGDPRIAAARYWAALADDQLNFEAIHSDAVFPMRYEALATEPTDVVPGMFEFLGEPWEPAALEFDSQDHDFGLQDNKIALTSKIELSSGGFRSWPEDILDRCCAIVEETAIRAGWSDVRDPLSVLQKSHE